jgi:hypothetical protein
MSLRGPDRDGPLASIQAHDLDICRGTTTVAGVKPPADHSCGRPSLALGRNVDSQNSLDQASTVAKL